MISKSEIDFFENIKDNCDIIFDVGCRTDIHYIEMKPEAQFHLFEPNEESYNEVKNKLKDISSDIKINNFGLGDKTAKLLYYMNTQSFPKRITHSTSNPETAKYCNVKKFTEYIEKNKISKIDFLKIDTEGYEPEILYDNIDFIKNNVKYVQFEYASTWLDKPTITTIHNIYEIYKDSFTFYYLYDENHPMCKGSEETLTIISSMSLNLIENYMRNAYGYNIVMIRK